MRSLSSFPANQARYDWCRRLAAFVVVIAAMASIFLAIPQARAVIKIEEAASPKLPAGHPMIGVGSPQVNPIPSISRMRTTAEIVSQNRTAFKKGIHLSALEMLTVQSKDELKTLDTWARESIHAICGYSSINGEKPLYTALDMAFRPQAWDNRNFIYIMAIPIRERLGKLVSQAEAKRILEQGTISPVFLANPEVRKLLVQIGSNSALSSSVAQISIALQTFQTLNQKLRIVPPAKSDPKGRWVQPIQLLPNLGKMAATIDPSLRGHKPLPGYTVKTAKAVTLAYVDLGYGWTSNNVAEANAGIKELAAALPIVNPPVYPDFAKRLVEVWYNRLFNGTLIGVFFYFVSLTLFLIAATGAYPAARKPAIVFFTLAVLLHATFMGIRWWLAGRIPIQNEFESVLGSAFIGCVVGLFLEYWKKNSLFGLAFSFVGFLAMTACFVVPFVLGKSIGANISHVDGVLNTYWLYIHVNVVISSYALIGASFCLGLVYLFTKLYYSMHPVDSLGTAPAALALAGGPALAMAGGGSGDGFDTGGGNSVSRSEKAAALAEERLAFLTRLDGANIIILQMAFWFLGTGIIFGAVWADYSWGRPWGWDPKETFALVTWLVYLIIVHLRFVTPKYRSDWTAWLSIVGFAVMMFNWIGVNFFLVGLHSYA